MKPAKFDYLRADTRDETLAALAEFGGDARVIAGGQSLLPMLNMRLARPSLLVDVMRVTEWQRAEITGNALRIGAGIRQAGLQSRADLLARVPLLAMALPWLGHAQTRSRGTLCGSVAHADPSAEVPLVLTTLGGMVHLRSQRRARDVQAAQFFTGMMATARQDDELIEAISLPLATPGAGFAFREVARRHGDFAIVGVAAMAVTGRVRLGVAGVADHPQVLEIADDPKLWEDALEQFVWSLEARDDLHASARYRRDLVRQLGRAVLEEACACRS